MRMFLMGAGAALLGLAGGVFAFASYIEPLAEEQEPLFTIEHDIAIDASADEVWKVLTDFGSYPEWNPYIRFIEGDADGELEIGDTITIEITQENFASLRLQPTIARFKERRTLGWHGTILVPGFHETDHYFEIEPQPDGRSHLHHAEEFRGWLAGLMDAEEQRAPTRDAFRAMNEALAERVVSLRAAAASP